MNDEEAVRLVRLAVHEEQERRKLQLRTERRERLRTVAAVSAPLATLVAAAVTIILTR